jgi:hypothetical protein
MAMMHSLCLRQRNPWGWGVGGEREREIERERLIYGKERREEPDDS